MRKLLSVAAGLLVVACTGLAGTAYGAGNEVFLFPYFQSNGQTGVFLSYSTDGLHFSSVNGGKAIFTPPSSWTGQTLTRDPSIIYHDGMFSMVWTTNWTGTVFGFAQSTDLKNWTNVQRITPFSGSQPQNVWAPEIVWNPVADNYRVVFSSAMTAANYNADNMRMYSITSNDLITFSTTTSATTFYNPGYSVIDGQTVYDAANSRWIMVYKNEVSGQKNLNIAYNASADMSGTWTQDPHNPITGSGKLGYLAQAAEGPTLLNDGARWRLYWDAYGNGHYGTASSTDLTTWTDLTSQMTAPVASPRHGTIFLAPGSAVGFPEVPEPTSLAMLALGATLLLRGRRQPSVRKPGRRET
jgi:hypothetical protein